jgi:hypothetical protein
MFHKTTPHTLQLEHFRNEAELQQKSVFKENLVPLLMIAIGVLGIYLCFFA